MSLGSELGFGLIERLNRNWWHLIDSLRMG